MPYQTKLLQKYGTRYITFDHCKHRHIIILSHLPQVYLIQCKYVITNMIEYVCIIFINKIIKGGLVEKLPSYGVLTPPHLTTSLTSHIRHHSHLTPHITSLTSHTTRRSHHSQISPHIAHITHKFRHITHITSHHTVHISHHISFTFIYITHITHIAHHWHFKSHITHISHQTTSHRTHHSHLTLSGNMIKYDQ